MPSKHTTNTIRPRLTPQATTALEFLGKRTGANQSAIVRAALLYLATATAPVQRAALVRELNQERRRRIAERGTLKATA